jgi:transcription-repair coupling factor (superfamily II helicase)
MAAKLELLRAGEEAVFEHVTEAAQPFLAGLLAQAARGRVWIVCPEVRRQETFHNELLNWFSDALFFPESDVSSVEGALPDPETVAERLAIVQKLTAAKGRQIIVLTVASLADEVPARDALKKLELRLARTTQIDREKFISNCRAPVTSTHHKSPPAVNTRSEAGSSTSFLSPFAPVRIELFDDEIESIGISISMRRPPSSTSTAARSCSAKPRRMRVSARAGSATTSARAISRSTRTPAGGSAGSHSRGSEGTELTEDFGTAFYDHGLGEFDAGDFVVDELKRERFFQQLTEWREAGWRVFIVCNNEGEIERLHDLIPAVEVDALTFTIGTQARGFTFRRRSSRCSRMRSSSAAIAIPARAASRSAGRASSRSGRKSISAS